MSDSSHPSSYDSLDTEDTVAEQGRGSNKTGEKRKRTMDYDETRRQEIRDTNRIAARECRARKKLLMMELEKTISNLNAEHNALMKHNRELSIRLETLQRSAAMGIGPLPNSLGTRGATSPAILTTGLSTSTPSLFSRLTSPYQVRPLLQ